MRNFVQKTRKEVREDLPSHVKGLFEGVEMQSQKNDIYSRGEAYIYAYCVLQGCMPGWWLVVPPVFFLYLVVQFRDN